VSSKALTGRRLGFMDGLIDGMLARRFWDRDLAGKRKTEAYVLGELWAVSTQPLAALAALLDWETLRETREGPKREAPAG